MNVELITKRDAVNKNQQRQPRPPVQLQAHDILAILHVLPRSVLLKVILNEQELSMS